jgi:hypothetical protein
MQNHKANRVNHVTGKIQWNYSTSDTGQVLHKITLSDGKGLLKTNMELIDLGILKRFDARKSGYNVLNLVKEGK